MLGVPLVDVELEPSQIALRSTGIGDEVEPAEPGQSSQARTEEKRNALVLAPTRDHAVVDDSSLGSQHHAKRRAHLVASRLGDGHASERSGENAREESKSSSSGVAASISQVSLAFVLQRGEARTQSGPCVQHRRGRKKSGPDGALRLRSRDGWSAQGVFVQPESSKVPLEPTRAAEPTTSSQPQQPRRTQHRHDAPTAG